jgi:hypothetical protein
MNQVVRVRVYNMFTSDSYLSEGTRCTCINQDNIDRKSVSIVYNIMIRITYRIRFFFYEISTTFPSIY